MFCVAYKLTPLSTWHDVSVLKSVSERPLHSAGFAAKQLVLPLAVSQVDRRIFVVLSDVFETDPWMCLIIVIIPTEFSALAVQDTMFPSLTSYLLAVATPVYASSGSPPSGVQLR